MCQIRRVSRDRIALEVRAGLFEISDPKVAKRLLRPSIKKSRPSQLNVGWSGVGRRIREVRGFDMIKMDISQNYLSMMERGQVETGAEILLNPEKVGVPETTQKSIVVERPAVDELDELLPDRQKEFARMPPRSAGVIRKLSTDPSKPGRGGFVKAESQQSILIESVKGGGSRIFPG